MHEGFSLPNTDGEAALPEQLSGKEGAGTPVDTAIAAHFNGLDKDTVAYARKFLTEIWENMKDEGLPGGMIEERLDQAAKNLLAA